MAAHNASAARSQLLRPSERRSARRALVLGGGGAGTIGWELGVLLGIADATPSLDPGWPACDLVVGTSSGATVAAQVTTEIALERLFAAQLEPDHLQNHAEVDLDELRALSRREVAATSRTAYQPSGPRGHAESAVPEWRRRAAIESRLPRHDWPATPLLIPALDASTGDLTIFTADSGVSLVDAVTASATAGAWSPTPVRGPRRIAGRARSLTNADLASGAQTILVITPTATPDPSRTEDLDRELAALGPAATYVVRADEASLDAFGGDPLSAATRWQCAEAGLRVGHAVAASVAAFWTVSAEKRAS